MTRVPDISVIIAAYNAERTIATAIESALGQAGVDLEIVVVDDASQDETAEIVQGFEDDRVRLVRMSRNGGPGAARNVGIETARGQWVAILDADDGYAQNRLARLLAAAEDDVDIVVDDLLEVLESGTTLTPVFGERLASIDVLTLADLIASDRIYGAEPGFGYLKPVFRREFLRTHSLFYDPDLRIGEDFAFLREALAAGAKAAVVAEPGYLYTRHAGSISHRIDAAQIRAIRVADAEFEKRWALRADAAAALDKRDRALRSAEAFASSVEALKTRRPMTALRELLRRPHAVALYRLPIVARLKRLLGGPAKDLRMRKRASNC